jgi:hypothetical protein
MKQYVGYINTTGEGYVFVSRTESRCDLGKIAG